MNSKNSLDLKIKKNTLNKSNFLRPQVDGITKKFKHRVQEENFSKTKIQEDEFLNENKKTEKIIEKKSETVIPEVVPSEVGREIEDSSIDSSKRLFFKVAGVAGLGLAASALFPKSADAYVTGSTPTSNVVGVRNIANTKINPATAEGQGVTKLTTSLSSSGIVRTPASGKKIRVYASRFSLTADATSVSFRFTSGGTDHEKYVSPKTGGLYGANNHPNYVEGGVDEVLYCAISGTTTVQINIDYLEV